MTRLTSKEQATWDKYVRDSDICVRVNRKIGKPEQAELSAVVIAVDSELATLRAENERLHRLRAEDMNWRKHLLEWVEAMKPITEIEKYNA
jgi:hypothetical protein